jgi:hypothetical protein
MKSAALSGATLIVGAIACLAYANGTLNHFYVFGAQSDSFWFAGLIWRIDARMTNPPSISPNSFYATHVSPFLYLPGLVSHIPWFRDPIEFFAGFIGLLHGLATAAFAFVGGYALLRAGCRSVAASIACLAIGLVLVLLPLQALFLQLPHYEIALPAALIAFLAALADRRDRLAATFFVALLCVREDAGLHAAMFLLAWSAALRLHGKAVDPRLLRYSALGIAWAAFAFWLGPFIAGGSQGIVRGIYLGDPLFAHMSFDQVAKRAAAFLLERTELWLPLAAIVVAALIRRDALLFAGVAAVLPWIALNVGFGNHAAPAKLSFYYAFPLLSAFAWPSLRLLIAPAETGARRSLGALQAAVLALGFAPSLAVAPPNRFDRWLAVDLFGGEGLAQAAQYRQFARTLERHRDTLGKFVATQDVIGLAPTLMQRHAWLEGVRLDDATRIATIDTILIFARPGGCVKEVAVLPRLQLPHAFDVTGTRVVIVTRRPVSDFDAWGPLLIERAPGTTLCIPASR